MPLRLALVLALSACTSVRTVEVAPTPDAVAAFVADATEAPAPELVGTLPPGSVRAVWLAASEGRRTSPNVVTLRRALDRLESVSTYVVGAQTVDVFAYPDVTAAKLAVPGLRSMFGRSPLQVVVPAEGAYYQHGPLVVRVLRPLGASDRAYLLDDGLGRPRQVVAVGSVRPGGLTAPSGLSAYSGSCARAVSRGDCAYVREVGEAMAARARAQVELVPPSSAAK